MKIKFLLPLLCGASFFLINNSFAQKKVVIMGSSTAAGSGATTYQLSWAGRLTDNFNKNTSDGLDTVFYNIAVPGHNTYQELPTGYIPPTGRPNPDPLCNVTAALSYNPDVIIISLPSNDVGNGYSLTETMNNFRMMYNSITASGAKCFITTTQPRNDYSLIQRQALLETKDSITAQFGLFTINFWDDLVTSDGLYMLRSDRKDPTSNIHPNDLGHDFLFGRVRDKNIFGLVVLPTTLTGFSAQVNNNTTLIKWHTEQQEPNTLFEIERSTNGINFETIVSLPVTESRLSANYSATDKNPLHGKSFYRIKVTEPSQKFYSDTIIVINQNDALEISRLYKDNTSSNLIVEINLKENENVLITIVNAAGVIMQQKKQYLSTPSERVVLPIVHLATGQYFIKISTNSNYYSLKAFIK
jgi:lysophospholipase L1-like esterase